VGVFAVHDTGTPIGPVPGKDSVPIITVFAQESEPSTAWISNFVGRKLYLYLVSNSGVLTRGKGPLEEDYTWDFILVKAWRSSDISPQSTCSSGLGQWTK
jgi:hypothetical protein